MMHGKQLSEYDMKGHAAAMQGTSASEFLAVIVMAKSHRS